jgi:DNA-binding response OmpR family regulator
MSGAKKILIVEDSTIIRIAVKRSLEQYGLEAIELDNAEDLFRIPGRFKDIDLIILDITLPGLDGLSALKQLKTDENLKYIPVIMLTGRADSATVKKALLAGAVNFIRKPFEKEEFVQRIERVLGPLKLKETQQVESLKAKIEAQLANEVMRAERGKTSLSLLNIRVLRGGQNTSNLTKLREAQTKIIGKLRGIDAVFLINLDNILIILPLTDQKGAAVVEEKLRKIYEELNITTKFLIVSYPENGSNSKELLKKLQLESE